MQALFSGIVQWSLMASLFALAVIALRLLLPHSPKWIICLLWGLVALRLICPVFIESDFSLIPNRLSNGQLLSDFGNQYIGDVDIIYENNANFTDAVNAGLTPIYSDAGAYVITAKGGYTSPATLKDTLLPVLSYVWLIGVMAMLFYITVSYITLRRKMAEATRVRENIWQCQAVVSPFVLGIFHPQIYLPYHISDEDAQNVLAHEQAHIQRKDHWWKPLGFLLLSIHWFNPVLWLSYVLLCRDIESACDEKVIRHMEKSQKQAYSTALLHCSVHHRRIAACPLAFGETGVKERIVHIMTYKKPAFWIVIAVIMVSIIAGVCFLTAPESPREPGVNDEKLLEMAHQVAQWDQTWLEQPLSILKKNETYQAILSYGSEAVDFYVDQLKKNRASTSNPISKEGKTQIVMALACAQITGIGADSYGTDWTSGQQWLKLYQSSQKSDYCPDLTVTNLYLDWQKKDLRCFGQNADIQQIWQAEYPNSETITASRSGLYCFVLSPSSDFHISEYKIYRSDGTLYDTGNRSVLSSRSLCVQQTDDGWQLIEPIHTGEYIYVLEVYWDAYDITLTYGLKIVVTEEKNGYELAHQKVVNYFAEQSAGLTVNFERTIHFGTATSHSYYYIFSVKGLSGGDRQVAVTVDGKIMYSYSTEGDTILFEEILE